MTQRPKLKEVNYLASLLGRIVLLCVSSSGVVQQAIAQDANPIDNSGSATNPSLESRLLPDTDQSHENEDNIQAVLGKYVDSGQKQLEKYNITVIDGDTVHYLEDGRKIKYRLADIDAPEHGQHGIREFETREYGKESTIALQNLIKDAKSIYFIPSLTAPSGDTDNKEKKDIYGRGLGYLIVEIDDEAAGSGNRYILVNAEQVRTGNALPTRSRYPPSNRNDLAAIVDEAGGNSSDDEKLDMNGSWQYLQHYQEPWIYRREH